MSTLPSFLPPKLTSMGTATPAEAAKEYCGPPLRGSNPLIRKAASSPSSTLETILNHQEKRSFIKSRRVQSHSFSISQSDARVQARFDISLDPSSIHFIALPSRHVISDSYWRRFTLLGQSAGSVWLALQGLVTGKDALWPDIFIGESSQTRKGS